MNQTVPQQPEKQERTKATFAIVDEMLKAYNGGETYVKRFLTFVGIGGVITGTALGYKPMVHPEPRTEPQPIIIHTAPPAPQSTPLKPATPAPAADPPARKPDSERQGMPPQPIARSKSKPEQPVPKPTQPLVQSGSKPVRTTPANRPPMTVQPPVTIQPSTPSITIAPPTLNNPMSSLPFAQDKADPVDSHDSDD